MAALHQIFPFRSPAVELTQDQWDHIVSVLAELQATTKNSERWLARLNGTVASDQKRITEIEIQMASRENSCPLVEAVREDIIQTRRMLDLRTTVQDATKEQNKVWMRHLLPIVRWLAYVIAAGAVGAHGKELYHAIVH